MQALFDDLPVKRSPAKPWKGEEPEKRRQRALFSGLDLLAGQLDLFHVDGQADQQEGNAGATP